MKSRLEAQLKALPARPGVYVFRDESGSVLYIGKAKSLRPRVRSYFQKGRGGARLGSMQLVEVSDRRAQNQRDHDHQPSGCGIAWVAQGDRSL